MLAPAAGPLGRGTRTWGSQSTKAMAAGMVQIARASATDPPNTCTKGTVKPAARPAPMDNAIV